MLIYFLVFSGVGFFVGKYIHPSKKAFFLLVAIAVLWMMGSGPFWGLVTLGELLCGFRFTNFSFRKILNTEGVKMNKTLIAVALAIASVAAQAQPHQIPELKNLNWQMSPLVGKVGDKGIFQIPESLLFLDAVDTNKFLQFNGNLPQTDSYTIATKKGYWFGILHFMNEGY